MGLFFALAVTLQCFAQADSVAPVAKSGALSRGDSMYLARLNTSGNLMIAGGVGLCGAGAYLIYQGVTVYNAKITPGPNAADDQQRNHRQGTIYLAAGGVAIAGGVVLTALGARNKVEFKQRKRHLQLETGMLPNGNLGLALTF